MRSWKDAVNVALRRSLLKLLAKASSGNTESQIKLSSFRTAVYKELKQYLNLHSHSENIEEEQCQQLIEKAFQTFRESYRNLVLDAQKEEQYLFDLAVRETKSDVFISETMEQAGRQNVIGPLLNELLNVFSRFEDLAPYLGYKLQVDFTKAGEKGDLHLATPFYRLILDEENFTGLDSELKKEQDKTLSYLENKLKILLLQIDDLAEKRITKMHRVSSHKKVDDRNAINFFHYLVTVLSNLLWHFIYPLSLAGERLSIEDLRLKFALIEQLFSEISALLLKPEYKGYYLSKELNVFLFHIQGYFKDLFSVYEQEQISSLSLRSIASNYQHLSRKLCEHVFKIVYKDESIAFSLASDINNLNKLALKDPTILSIFDDRPPYYNAKFVNDQTKTILDIIILFSSSTYDEQKKWVDDLASKNASDASKQFSVSLKAFRQNYVSPIKEKMRELEGWSFWDHKQIVIAEKVSQRLIPLIILALNEYRFDLQSELAHDNEELGDPFKFQMNQIVNSFLDEQEYKFDLLHFLPEMEEELCSIVKRLPILKHQCLQLASFLVYANGLLDAQRAYLKYQEFRHFFSALFEKTYKKAHELDEEILGYAGKLENESFFKEGDKQYLTRKVTSIRNQFIEFNEYYSELAHLPDCPYPNREIKQHVRVLGQGLSDHYEKCFGETVELVDEDSLSITVREERQYRRRASQVFDMPKLTRQMIQLSGLIGSCTSSLTLLSKRGYKGGYLRQLHEQLILSPITEEKAKQVVLELARIVCCYRRGVLGFHADYACSKSAEALIDAILDSRQYLDLPLTEWLFGPQIALSIENSQHPRQSVQQALVRLQQINGWALVDREIGGPRVNQGFDSVETNSPTSTVSSSVSSLEL